MREWREADEDQAKQQMPDEVVEDAKEAVTTLANFAMFLKIANGADIQNSPVIQELSIGTEDVEELEEDETNFRVTIQQIPELTEEL